MIKPDGIDVKLLEALCKSFGWERPDNAVQFFNLLNARFSTYFAPTTTTEVAQNDQKERDLQALTDALATLRETYRETWLAPYLDALYLEQMGLQNVVYQAIDWGAQLRRETDSDLSVDDPMCPQNRLEATQLAYALTKEITEKNPVFADAHMYTDLYATTKRALRQLEQLSWEDYVEDQLKVVDDLLKEKGVRVQNPWKELSENAQKTIHTALYRARTATTLGVALDRTPHHQEAQGDDAFRLVMGRSITREQALLAKQLVLQEAEMLTQAILEEVVDFAALYVGRALYPAAFEDHFNPDQDAIYNLAVFKAAEARLRKIEARSELAQNQCAQRISSTVIDDFHGAYEAQVKNNAHTTSFALINKNADILVNFE